MKQAAKIHEPAWHLSRKCKRIPKQLRKYRLRHPIMRVFLYCEAAVGNEYIASNGLWINPLTGKCSTHEIYLPEWERHSAVTAAMKVWAFGTNRLHSAASVTTPGTNPRKI